jgi:acyl-CoA synthetase (AMP-forming)/AMP-acid ligase II
MDVRINRLSHGLLALGMTTGHKVAVLLNNCLESAMSLLGIPRAGLAYISLNARHSAKEHMDVLNDSETDAVIVGEEFIHLLQPIVPSVPSLKHLIVVGTPQPGRLTYNELVADQPETTPDVDVDYDKDIERIQYTSGTTGRTSP